MTEFTPISGFIGGVLIGISVVLMMWLFGRITGISGFLHGLLPPQKSDSLWRFIFLLGLVSGGITFYLLPAIQYIPRAHYPPVLLIFAGLLVGFGTRMGGGCTSGHGVCGVSRLSARSIIATITFIVTGILATYFIKHVWVVS